MKKIITSKRIRQLGCVLLAIAILLPIMQVTVGFPRVLAIKNSFAPYLTSVTATHPDGSAIVDPIAKDAEVNINLQFAVPSDLNSGTYSFSLPKAVTANAALREFVVDAGVRGTATVSIPADGNCAITFEPLPPTTPVIPPEAVIPPEVVIPPDATVIDPLQSVDTGTVIVKADSATAPILPTVFAGGFTITTQLAPEYITEAGGIAFEIGLGSVLLPIPFVADAPKPNQMMGSARSGGDFNGYFNHVTITSNGSPISDLAVVPKDAPIVATFKYKIPAGGLNVGAEYAFNIPEAVAKNAPRSINIEDGSTIAAVVTINDDGNCKIEFKESSYVDENTEGEFMVECNLAADEIPNGTIELVFFQGTGGVGGIKIPINFALTQIDGSVTLANKCDPASTNSPLKWVVDVEPTLTNADVNATDGTAVNKLINFKIENTVDEKLVAILSGGSNPPILKKNDAAVNGATFAFDGGKFTCTVPTPLDWAVGEKYQLEYYTSYDLSAFNTVTEVKFTNKANASFEYHQFAAGASSSNITLSTTNKTATATQIAAEIAVTKNMLSKKELSYAGSTHTIKWEVVVNEGAVGFDGTLTMTDIIPAGLKLTKVSLNGSEITEPDYAYTSTDYSGDTLKVPNLAKDAKSTITYETEIDPEIWSKQSSKTFNNEVSYTGAIGGTGGKSYSFTRKANKTCNFGGAEGGFIAASGVYNKQNHTIDWTVTVNKDSVADTGGTVVIDGFAGHTVVGTPADYNVTDKKFTINVASSAASTEVKFQTTVDDPRIWATNNTKGSESFSITAQLTGSSGGQAITLSSTATVKPTSEVIAKTSPAYDYNSKEITWKIVFNQNQMAMDNIVITDTLPAGTTYVAGSAVATDVTLNSATASGQTLTMQFSNLSMGATVPSVTYKTKITDDTLLKPTAANDTSAKFKNSAEISFNQLGSTPKPTVTHERTVGSRPLQKSGTKNDGFRNITWTVNINPNQTNYGSIILEDVLQNNLLLDLESVKLYEATVGSSDGALTQGSMVYNGESTTANTDFAAKLVGQTFTFEFKTPLVNAYILVFDTDNVDPGNTSYGNTIQFKGKPNSTNSLASNISQSASGSGSTNQKRSTITLTAKDQDSGAAIKGVKYTITDTKTGNKITVTTNDKGIAMFTPLKFDTYTITEDLSGVSGYTPMASPEKIITASSNREPAQTLKYKKNAEKVTINYEVNISGVTDTVPPKEYVKGAKVTAIDNPYTTVTNKFLGWNTQTAGLGTAYNPGDEITLDSDVTLFAQWEKKSPPPTPDPPIPTPTPPTPNPIPPNYYPPVYYPPTPSPAPATKPTTPAPKPTVTAPTQPAGWSMTTSLDVSAITSTPLKSGKGGLVLTAVFQNGRAIEGVQFRVFVDGNWVTAKTDASGIVSFPDIQPGDYPIQVVGVPDGYEFESTDAFSAAVPLEQWATGEVRVRSASKTRVPQTGDTLPLSLGFGAIGAILLICTHLTARKK